METAISRPENIIVTMNKKIDLFTLDFYECIEDTVMSIV